MDTRRQEISARFMETWHRIDNLHARYAKSLGVSFTAMTVLAFLSEPNEVYTQKDLCDKLGMPKQGINAIIKSFWEQGYVALKEAKDRRNKKIFLTETGKAYAQDILSHFEAVDEKAWQCFTSDELLHLAEAMEKYEKTFERVAFS